MVVTTISSHYSNCIIFRFLEHYTLWHYSLWQQQQQQYSKIGMAPGQAEIHCHYIGINGGNHMQYSNGFSKTPYRNVKTTVCPKIHEGIGSSSQKITKQRSPPELWWREIIQMMMIVNISINLGPNILALIQNWEV